jgi:hypothetical protein
VLGWAAALEWAGGGICHYCRKESGHYYWAVGNWASRAFSTSTCRGMKIAPGALTDGSAHGFVYSLPRSKASKLSKRKGSNPFAQGNAGTSRTTLQFTRLKQGSFHGPSSTVAQPSSHFHPSLVKSTSIRSLAGAALCVSLHKTRNRRAGVEREGREGPALRRTRFH